MNLKYEKIEDNLWELSTETTIDGEKELVDVSIGKTQHPIILHANPGEPLPQYSIEIFGDGELMLFTGNAASYNKARVLIRKHLEAGFTTTRETVTRHVQRSAAQPLYKATS